MFTWGKGPTIKPSDLGPINIEKGILGLTGGIKGDPAPLMINMELFEELEKAEGRDRDYWLFLIAVTILHETVHYGYIQNGLTTETLEEGNDFEKNAYGEVVKMKNYKRIMDQWLEKRLSRSTSSSNSGSRYEIFWTTSSGHSNGGNTTNSSNSKKKDADKQAAKRSGG